LPQAEPPADPRETSTEERRMLGADLHLDCFAGLAGDMFLGAMIDLGVPKSWLLGQLASLRLGGYELSVGIRTHHAIAGCDVRVQYSAPAGTEHHHRSHRDIIRLIESSEIATSAKVRALAIFDRLARAEARVHAIAVDQVTFHEVGAIDSIVDIVGAALSIDYLKPRRITCRAVPLGSGMTRSAHGALPIPSPAALDILREAGAAVEAGPAGIEACTPTGAAIAATLVDEYCPMPGGQVLAIGYGAGDREVSDHPNHLRALLLDASSSRRANQVTDQMILIESNLDDMNAELAAYLLEQLLHEGARDVWHTPIVMKKGRPATQISVLCDDSRRAHLLGVLFAESSAIGARFSAVQRSILHRRTLEVLTIFGPVTVKEAYDNGKLLNAAPEFESCRSIAERTATPLKRVYAAALAAYWNTSPVGSSHASLGQEEPPQ
jgi:uncharacterized protein (TIGR00299 family) protein